MPLDLESFVRSVDEEAVRRLGPSSLPPEKLKELIADEGATGPTPGVGGSGRVVQPGGTDRPSGKPKVRPEHYYFAHTKLRSFAFAEPETVFGALHSDQAHQ
jgi:hypothetical protein